MKGQEIREFEVGSFVIYVGDKHLHSFLSQGN